MLMITNTYSRKLLRHFVILLCENLSKLSTNYSVLLHSNYINGKNMLKVK